MLLAFNQYFIAKKSILNNIFIFNFENNRKIKINNNQKIKIYLYLTDKENI